jgi:hypothetical protein
MVCGRRKGERNERKKWWVVEIFTLFLPVVENRPRGRLIFSPPSGHLLPSITENINLPV